MKVGVKNERRELKDGIKMRKIRKRNWNASRETLLLYGKERQVKKKAYAIKRYETADKLRKE